MKRTYFKPGELVVLIRGGVPNKVLSIAQVHETHVICSDGYEWSPRGAHEHPRARGGGQRSIVRATDEILDLLEKLRLQHWVSAGIRWYDQPLDVLRRVRDAVGGGPQRPGS